jgi:hypothetical protein
MVSSNVVAVSTAGGVSSVDDVKNVNVEGLDPCMDKIYKNEGPATLTGVYEYVDKCANFQCTSAVIVTATTVQPSATVTA